MMMAEARNLCTETGASFLVQEIFVQVFVQQAPNFPSFDHVLRGFLHGIHGLFDATRCKTLYSKLMQETAPGCEFLTQVELYKILVSSSLACVSSA